MALYLQSDTKLFSRQISSICTDSYDDIFIPFWPIWREKKFTTGNVATYVLGYKIFFFYYVIFLIKILKVACLKTNTFTPILVLKKSLHKRCMISICINRNIQVYKGLNRSQQNTFLTSPLSNWLHTSAIILKVQRTRSL